MKLFIVKFKEPVRYIDVKNVAARIDPVGFITVVEQDLSYEFQSEKLATEVANEFEGSISVIEYDVNDLYKA